MANIDRFLTGGKSLNREIKADKTLPNDLLRQLYKFVGIGQPMMISEDKEAMITEGYMLNHNVFTVVDWVCNKAAGVERKVYRVVNDSAAKEYKYKTKNYSEKNLLESVRLRKKAFEEVDSTALNELIAKPNPYQDSYEFIYENTGFNILTGISIGYLVSPESGPNKGLTKEIWNVPTHLCEPISGGIMKPLRGYTLMYSHDASLELPIEQCLIRRQWNPNYNDKGANWMGMSRLSPGRNVIRQSNDTAIAAMKLLQNQGAIGVLSNASDAENMMLGEGATDDLNRLYKQKYGGVHRYGEIIVSSYNLKWQNMGMNAVDLQLDESDMSNLRKICNLLQVDSKMFNDPSASTQNNLEISRRNSFIDAVLPHVTSFDNRFNEKISSQYSVADGVEYYVGADIEAIPEMQEDMNKLAERLEKMDYWTGNEQREASGQDRLDDERLDAPRFLTSMGNEQVDEGDDVDEELEKSLRKIWNK